MSAHIVVRKGTGHLHIAEPTRNGYTALCGTTIRQDGSKIHVWSAGRAAKAVWAEWARCSRCEKRDHELRNR